MLHVSVVMCNIATVHTNMLGLNQWQTTGV